MKKIYHAALAAFAAGAVAACHNNNNRATDSAYGTLPTNSPTGTAFSDTSSRGTPGTANASSSATTPESTSTAAGAAAPGTSPNGAMSDANILATSEIGDSAEVAIADYMAANTNNPKVKAYANMLRSDHSKGMSKVKSTAAKLSLTMQLPANDTTAQETSHVLDHLKSLNGADRDTAFVNHEVEDHQHDIAEAKQLAQSAQNPQVKSLEQNELPVLQKHLSHAETLTKQLGK